MPTSTTRRNTPRQAQEDKTREKYSAPDGQGLSVHQARRAAAQVLDKHSITVTLPDDLGTLRLPEPQRLAFYGGLAALAVFGIVEWPVALVLGIGHILADDHHHKCLCEFGEALAEA